jgi:hypothetical protein
MQIEGALIREQGISFAIVIVKPHVLNSNSECETMRRALLSVFVGVPIILMAQNHNGIPTYQGRTDIVHFLANIDASRIPWKRFTIN